MEDKSNRTETARLQFGECCESQSECDSALSVKVDGNDIELLGDGIRDGSAQVRNFRDPGQLTANKHQVHMTTHRPYRSWCKFCVMGRGVISPHRGSDAQDDLEGVLHVSMDYGFLGERESEEQVTPVLVIRERRLKMTWAMLVPRKRSFPGSQREQRSYRPAWAKRCDSEPAIEALARERSHKLAKRQPDRPCETTSGGKPVQ